MINFLGITRGQKFRVAYNMNGSSYPIDTVFEFKQDSHPTSSMIDIAEGYDGNYINSIQIELIPSTLVNSLPRFTQLHPGTFVPTTQPKPPTRNIITFRDIRAGQKFIITSNSGGSNYPINTILTFSRDGADHDQYDGIPTMQNIASEGNYNWITVSQILLLTDTFDISNSEYFTQIARTRPGLTDASRYAIASPLGGIVTTGGYLPTPTRRASRRTDPHTVDSMLSKLDEINSNYREESEELMRRVQYCIDNNITRFE